VATVAGGAIYILGATAYHVLDSVFYGNAVAPATWVSSASYALIISTAQSGASEQMSAMWSIDDGPVFGLSTADCGTAQQASAEGIGRGLAPSWPDDAPCANDTVYQPFKLYTHELILAEGNYPSHRMLRPSILVEGLDRFTCCWISLCRSLHIELRVCVGSAGDHVLHLGVFVRIAATAKWTGGGKIEVVGLLDPTFPEFDDDRGTLRYPGCFVASGFPHSCPSGDAFWVDLPVHVGIGKVRSVSIGQA
jgi:hypothetical protein